MERRKIVPGSGVNQQQDRERSVPQRRGIIFLRDFGWSSSGDVRL